MRRLLLALRLPVCVAVIALAAPWHPVHGQTEPEQASLSSDLAAFLDQGASGTVRVIADGDPVSLLGVGLRHGARVRRTLDHGAVFDVTPAQLNNFRHDPLVHHLSGDVAVLPTMQVTNPTIGADQVWAGWNNGLLGLVGYPGVTGKGIGIAVIDSGITSHPAVNSQIAVSVDLATNAVGTKDQFGHGTHVAGIIAGQASAAAGVTSLYTGGVAPGAKLINVRVLDGSGVGFTSDVIAGIDWAIANRQPYNIRVINLSLGHPVLEPSSLDPLCQAVARAVGAGIVVVASAGNAGRTQDGRQVLGGITSPGDSPYAITVGATNTHGTIARTDDTLASYSSRGPTKFEFAVKPDVVAPGTHIIAPEARDSWIARSYPAFHTAGNPTNAYMSLSGTSMSAAVVSGGVALLLQANPYLTPQQVKLALQTTATFMPGAGVVGAGAGNINLRGARQVAGAGLVTGLVTKIAGLLTPSSGAAYWDGGTMINRLYAGTGLHLISVLEAPLVWLNPNLLAWGNFNLLGVTNPLATVAPNYIVWGEIAGWSSTYYIVWGEQIANPQGEYIVWGETNSNYIVWGESVSPDGQ